MSHDHNHDHEERRIDYTSRWARNETCLKFLTIDGKEEYSKNPALLVPVNAEEDENGGWTKLPIHRKWRRNGRRIATNPRRLRRRMEHDWRSSSLRKSKMSGDILALRQKLETQERLGNIYPTLK